MIEPDFLWKVFAKAFHEKLEVAFSEGFAFWKVIVVVSQRDVSVVLVERRFVDAPDGPLAGTFQTTADTLPAGQSDRPVDKAVFPVEDDRTFPV